jgi:hypothetical protein
MGKIQSHRDLIVWQKDMDLALLCSIRAKLLV